jgi:hypothetical protein
MREPWSRQQQQNSSSSSSSSGKLYLLASQQQDMHKTEAHLRPLPTPADCLWSGSSRENITGYKQDSNSWQDDYNVTKSFELQGGM